MHLRAEVGGTNQRFPDCSGFLHAEKPEVLLPARHLRGLEQAEAILRCASIFLPKPPAPQSARRHNERLRPTATTATARIILIRLADRTMAHCSPGRFSPNVVQLQVAWSPKISTSSGDGSTSVRIQSKTSFWMCARTRGSLKIRFNTCR